MLVFNHKTNATIPNAIVMLDYQQRQKSRLRTRTVDGDMIGIALQRGEKLDCGSYLRNQAGQVLEIQGKQEALTEIEAEGRDLAVLSFQLAGHHVACSIHERYLRYRSDPLLDHWLSLLGFTLEHRHEIFEPEPRLSQLAACLFEEQVSAKGEPWQDHRLS